MNLAGRAFTYINLRVQPSVRLAELFTGFHRDSLGNESHKTYIPEPDNFEFDASLGDLYEEEAA